jgi:hypothetical protein
MTESRSEEEISKRFEQIWWHDSKLGGIAIVADKGSRGDVVLQIHLLTGDPSKKYEWSPVEVRFLETRIFQCELDFLGLRYCGSDIACGTCPDQSNFLTHVQTDIINKFDLPQTAADLANLRHFCIEFINPGGEINIIARDFEIRPLA